MMKESPLYAKSYDFVRWLIPQTVKFPREQRFVIASRLQDATFDYMEALYRATEKRQRYAVLLKADNQIKLIRFYLRLCHDLSLLNTRRFEHASRLLEEMGRLLGGWLKLEKT